MKMINRFITFAGALLFVSAFFTGCLKNDDGSVKENPNEIHIRVWESKDGVDQFIKQAGKAYTKLHPNIIIDYVYVELHGAVETLENDLPKGVGPDLIPAPHDNLGAIVEKKLIVHDLQKYNVWISCKRRNLRSLLQQAPYKRK